MVKGFPLTKSLALISNILPFYGYIDEWCNLMLRLCRKSNKIWKEGEEILIRIIKLKRTITLHSFNDTIMNLINLKILKYFSLNVENIDTFIDSLMRRLLSKQAHPPNSVDDLECRLQYLEKELEILPHHTAQSTYPDFIFLGDIKLDLNNLEEISDFLVEREKLKMQVECITSDDRMLMTESSNISFIPSFSLMNNTELAYFYNYERREHILDLAYDIESKMAELNKPFIEHIGTLKINVEWDKFLRKFFSICDTKIDSIEILNSLKIDGDMFGDNDDLSKTLKLSVKTIQTNKSFENTCHRFSNVENIVVQNFPAVNNLLTTRIQKLKHIDFIAETFSSTINIYNSFIVTNSTGCEPLYWEKLTAHFSNEDISISDDCKYLFVGGNMISISGISFPNLLENLKELINQGKDVNKGTDRIIVLLDNDANYPIVSATRKFFSYPRQSINLKANFKYIDLKIKKVNVQIEVNSNGDLLKIQQPSNEKFIQWLKLLINGKGNLAAQKLGFCIKNQIVQSLSFEVQKYADGWKLLDNLSSLMPSSFQTIGILVAQSNGGLNSENDEDKLLVSDKLVLMKRKYPKLEIILQDFNCEQSLILYQSQIMKSSFHAEKSS